MGDRLKEARPEMSVTARNPARQFLTAALILAASLFAAPATGQTSPPAPYKPLPVGTVLEYTAFQCTIADSKDFTRRCRGPVGERMDFFAKLVPFGPFAAKGYGSGQHLANCEIDRYSKGADIVTASYDRISLSDESRTALRALWPLEIGRQVAFGRRFHPVPGEARSTIRVTGTKTVPVAGEQRSVYVLEGRTTELYCTEAPSGDAVRVGFDETWWYSPDLATVVHYRISWTDTADLSQNFSYDLKRIEYPSAPAAIAQTAPDKSMTGIAAIDTRPPEIEAVESLGTDSAVIRVAGRVRDESRILEVTVEGQPVPIAPNGAFAVTRGVTRGDSTLVIVAIDEWGNTATRRIAVRRETQGQTPPTMAAATRPVAAAAAGGVEGLHFGRYHALVIGNNRYKSLPGLNTAEADARSVSALLRDTYGFDVTMRLNATRGDVLGELATMRATLTANDSLLVYYAGHGVVDRVTEQGYWLPVDADRINPANWISTWDITNMLRAIRAKHVMVVADSCYSGTLVRAAPVSIRTTRERRAWIERVLGKRARTALVSGGLEPVLDGGGDGHSVFAKAFIDALRENRGVLEGEALFDAIKRPVALNSNQTPQYSDIRLSGHEGGDFLFVRR